MKEESSTLRRQVFRVAHLAAAGTTIQSSNAVLREMPIDYFLLMIVRQGRRTVRCGDIVCTAGPGEGILLTPGVYDVINAPDGAAQPYRSDWLAWDADLLQPFGESGPGEPAPVHGAKRLSLADPCLEEAFDRARAALERSDQLPSPILRHRVLEVLLWLRERGLRLAATDRKTLGSHIRQMVAADPAADWSTALLASAFMISEATLRRRLAAEGYSARQLISETRMWRALSMLQSTDLPVYRIATDCGYVSTSRFAARFRARFDMAPSAVRGHRRNA